MVSLVHENAVLDVNVQRVLDGGLQLWTSSEPYSRNLTKFAKILNADDDEAVWIEPGLKKYIHTNGNEYSDFQVSGRGCNFLPKYSTK